MHGGFSEAQLFSLVVHGVVGLEGGGEIVAPGAEGLEDAVAFEADGCEPAFHSWGVGRGARDRARRGRRGS